MKIRFLQDYQGRETAMAARYAGDVADMSVEAALALIHLGIAVEEQAEGGKYASPKRKRREVSDNDQNE